MRRKLTALLILLVILVTGLPGCSKQDNKETGLVNNSVKDGQTGNGMTKEPTMGRYMEQTVKLPELSAEQPIIKVLKNKDKQIEVYTLETDKYVCYRLLDDMTWESSLPGWLNNESIQSANKIVSEICMGEDGNYYGIYNDYSDNSMKSRIVRSADGGKTVEFMEIPYLEEETTTNDYKHYPYIFNLQVMKAGNIVLNELYSNTLIVFSPEGKEIDKIRVGERQSYITSGEDIITLSEEGTGIMFYNPAQKKIERTVDFINNASDNAYAIRGDGTLLLGNSGGIHRLQQDGTLWETVVDGALNSMSMPTLGFNSLFVTEGEQEEYYAVYGETEGGYQLVRYVFDRNVASVPSKEITVYSLRENDTIRQAISLFQAENTDIKVNYVVAMEEEDGNVTDYIRALNTELLAGNGADILVLDGLPVDSYIEKGVLADLKDLVKPLEESGELMNNITGCYEKDGKVYNMPIRFSFPVIAGKPDAIQAADSLSNIVNYIKQTDNKPYLKSTSYKRLLEDYLALYSEDLFQNGRLKEENFTAFLTNVKTIADNIKATENDERVMGASKSYEKMFSGGTLFKGDVVSIRQESESVMLQIKNIFDTMLLFEVLKDDKLEQRSINRRFIPGGLVGLNSKSKEIDIARQFISFLFGTKVQDTNVFDGFPVNSKSLKEWTAKIDSNISIAVTDENGNMLSAVWPAEEDRNTILNLAEEVNQPINTNYILNNLLIEEVLPFLNGEIDESQAMSAVKAKVNTYLAE